MRLSVSRINCFLEDPRKYWYIYEMGIQTPKSEGFYFGSAVHAGLEQYYLKKDPMQGVAQALFGKKDSLKEQPNDKIDLHKLYTQSRKIFDIYPKQAPKYNPLFVEKWFEIDLIHPLTKEQLPVKFAGKMDLITVEGDVIDHKTAGGKSNGYFDDSNFIQATGYAYAYLTMFGKLPRRFVFNQIIKGNSKREPSFEEKVFSPTIEDICKFIDTCKDVAIKISKGETKDFPSEKHKRVCPCKDICPYCNGEL